MRQSKAPALDGKVTTMSTNSTVRKQASKSQLDWSKLNPVTIRDLRLFETAAGKVLEGVLVTSPMVQVRPPQLTALMSPHR